ncbi:TetR/AcrR family transcriptional regulator [Nocardioides nanhaiensis]|uniref:TetR/AcrR family transcriptional regulator n=1 Tax=Nocardioides nanhaiensis TaxID=1476871 RepID=A0ABP8W7T7_9ACTN
MPKVVDHAARRAEIADAVGRVVLAEGTAAATVRRVAAEAGWSPGAVRHYFPDQAALLRLVIARAYEQVPARVETHLRAWFEDATVRTDPRGAAQRLMEEVLPLDEQRLLEMHVWLATMDASRLDPALDQARGDAHTGMRQLARIATSWVRGRELDPDLGRLLTHPLDDPDDEQASATLHALVDGLAVESFLYPGPVDQVRTRETLRAHLAMVGLSRTAGSGRSG